ncbi:hypothetical protein [Streptomyces sp. NPDC048489]|uniref:hypothetical protein n=1 Tax=Streptomyces sp. NPDC048489 TaxID=3154504 RepID=UPI0034478C35
MPTADPTPASEADPPDSEPRPQDGPVPVGPSAGPAGTATAHRGAAGGDEVAEYEPL